MDKMIVAVFDTEPGAYDGLKALSELHREGTLTVYSDAVIAKDATGKVAMRQSGDKGPVGTLLGGATGSLIGLLGGPAGAAMGMYAGSLSGAAFDIANLGVGADFLDEVSKQLVPGKAAVVAEIEEEWIAPLNDRIEKAGGTVYRRSRSQVIDYQDQRDAEALRQEIDQMQAEMAQTKGEAKEKLNRTIANAQASLKAAENRAKARVDEVNKTMVARMQALKDQASRASGEAKARLEQQIAHIKSEHDTRTTKLHQAWQLTKEAFGITVHR